MIGRIFLLPLACFATLSAQSSAAAAPASVSGTVTNSLTGDPILRAHVALESANEDGHRYGALTNEAGKFTISPLVPGQYNLSVERIGFVMEDRYGPFLSGMIDLASGDKKDGVKLSLTPTGAITGRVVDARGEPMYRAMVTAENAGFTTFSVTDEQGRYRIGSLPPGKYRVRATPHTVPFAPEIRTDGTWPVHYATTYYPDSTMRATARRLDLQAGAELSGTDIRLASTPLVVVSGKVSGVPAGSVRTIIGAVRSEDKSPALMSERGANSDGTFAVSGWDPGRYTLYATAIGPGRQPNLQIAQIEIEVSGTNIEHLELQGIAPFEVRGQLRFDNEKLRFPQAQSDRRGQPEANSPPPPARPIHLDAADHYPGVNPKGEIAVDDSFVLENVPPSRYHVSLPWTAAYVRSVRTGNTETEGDVLDLRNGTSGPVVVSVSSATCEISGTVTDVHGPVANAQVVLFPETAGSRPVTYTSTDPAGAYKFNGVRPGKYRLSAVATGFYSNQTQAADALEDYQDVAVSIELLPGDKFTRDLKRK